jgi:hypothetical protein
LARAAWQDGYYLDYLCCRFDPEARFGDTSSYTPARIDPHRIGIDLSALQTEPALPN